MSGRHSMRRAFFSRLWWNSPQARVALLLLAVLQIIAPLWHVCEMGGHCQNCPGEASAQVCHIQATTTASDNATSTPKCSRCKTGAGAVLESDSRLRGFSGTCLARELTTMGRVHVASITLDFQITRVRQPRPTDVEQRDIVSLPQPPSRGPPLFL